MSVKRDWAIVEIKKQRKQPIRKQERTLSIHSNCRALYFSKEMCESIKDWSGFDFIISEEDGKTLCGIKNGDNIQLKDNKNHFSNAAMTNLLLEIHEGCTKFKLEQKDDIFIILPRNINYDETMINLAKRSWKKVKLFAGNLLFLSLYQKGVIQFSNSMKRFIENWTGIDVVISKEDDQTIIGLKEGNGIKCNLKNKKQCRINDMRLSEFIIKEYNGCTNFYLEKEDNIFILVPRQT